MIILGINAFHGDSSAALYVDGELVAAVEEERLRRIKHWAGFPSESIRYCLSEAGVKSDQVDHVAFSRDPMAHLFEKIVYTIRSRPKPGFVIDRLKAHMRARGSANPLTEAFDISSGEIKSQIHHVEHHLSHSASAFLVSPFDEAAVVSIDAMGDFRSTLISIGEGSNLHRISGVGYPHSLGIFYTAITQYLGFLQYGDEYKVMGLASYGEPTYVEEIRNIVTLESEGKFKLNERYFLHSTKGVTMTWDNAAPEIGRLYSEYMEQRLGPHRQPDDPVTERHKNIASSLQVVLEEAYFHILNAAQKLTGKRTLALAGGVAMNSVANGKIFDNTEFDDVYIQAAAGDGGTALGAAAFVYNQTLAKPRTFHMRTAYWGPHYSEEKLQECLENRNLEYEKFEVAVRHTQTAKAIAAGKIVGYFQGRLEWGPRALGNRSILADPRRSDMKDILNARIKRRESFRPFAPSILEEAVSDFFEQDYPDPFMLKVYPVKADKQDVIPAVTHVDGSGRLQTVNQHDNPDYWHLIKEFEALTGVPIVLNTSFNENEPIVCTPDEAIECFLRTHMEVLVLGPFFVEKQADTSVSE